MMTSDLHKIMYSSSAVTLFTQDELEHLMTLAREKNRHFSVTGCMIYHDGNIIQYLEGPKNAVQHIFQSIQSDPRHTGIIELCHAAIPARMFSDWQMALKYIPGEHLRHYQTIHDLFEDIMETAHIDQFCQQAKIFFETFLNVTSLKDHGLGVK